MSEGLRLSDDILAKSNEKLVKSAFPVPAGVPTQEGAHGVRYDFDLGCRVALPADKTGWWHVRLRHLDAGNVLFDYSLGIFFDNVAYNFQPADFRAVGLHRTAGCILGVDPQEERAKIEFVDNGRPLQEKYVCIAAQASSQRKYWNNSQGWCAVVSHLKAAGYRVICIDQKLIHGAGLVWNCLTYGAEDETGDRLLAARARWLKHAAFFVGLSSGLTWLAWSTGTPVVMISSFTRPTNELYAPYRVINWHVFNSCWNDPKHKFYHKDFLWCPRHKGTPKQFECTRLITTKMVVDAIDRVIADTTTKISSLAA